MNNTISPSALITSLITDFKRSSNSPLYFAPATSDPNKRLWEYRNIYTVVVKKSAFGAAGFGKVAVNDQHNSPVKSGLKNSLPLPCGSIVTNTALAAAKAGNQMITNSAQAIVRIQ